MNRCKACGTMYEGKFCPTCGTAAPVSVPARRQCFKCGAALEADAHFCSVCGTPMSADAPAAVPAAPVGTEEGREKPADGQPPAVLPPAAGCRASAATASTEGPDTYASDFTGGAFALFFINLLTVFVTIVTLTLAYPAMKCWQMRWEVKHTLVNGRRLVFDGKAGQLFGKALLWMLLTVVTVCIYGFWLPVKIKKWIATHTKFDHPQTFLPPSADMIAAASAAKQPRQTQQTLAEQLVLKKAKDARACCIMGFVVSLVFLVMLVVGLAVLASVGGSEALGSLLDWNSIMVVTVIGSMSIGTSARGVALRKYDLPKSHLILGIVGLVLGVLLTLGMYGSTYWLQIVLLFRHL